VNGENAGPESAGMSACITYAQLSHNRHCQHVRLLQFATTEQDEKSKHGVRDKRDSKSNYALKTWTKCPVERKTKEDLFDITSRFQVS